MTGLTGLFRRGSSYYIQVVLPLDHPLKTKYKNGKCVASLGPCSYRDALRLGTLKRAEILRGAPCPANQASTRLTATPPPPVTNEVLLREVFLRWKASKHRSLDSINACQRALCQFEEFTKNTDIASLTRDQGDGFRAWLLHTDRATSSKTARDRFTWIKSLLKYACRDLGLVSRSPWEGLEIISHTTEQRRTWTDDEIATLLTQPLFASTTLPPHKKAGGIAAYWIPLLGLFTGARVSELAQLRVVDIATEGEFPSIHITNEGQGQSLKTKAARRTVPIHSELIRLGFLDYVRGMQSDKEKSLWPALPLREGKPGGYFSEWFGQYRRFIGLGRQPDFHSFRHTVRSQLANCGVPEPLIDYLVGHEVKGSTGAKVYTHRSPKALKRSIEVLCYATSSLRPF